jgi:hypothetical protein
MLCPASIVSILCLPLSALASTPSPDTELKLQASDGLPGIGYGNDIRISNDSAIVGANTFNGGVKTGGAYVVVRDGATWVEEEKLVASDGLVGDEMGYSVAIFDDVAAVGAHTDKHAVGLPGSETGEGSVYVFDRSGSTWTETQILRASDALAGDDFGHDVDIDGDTLITGAPKGHGAFTPGAAYIFVRDAFGVWAQQAKLTPSDGGASDFFGWSVGISGHTAVVGAFNKEAAYVFVRSGSTWSQQAKLTAADAASGDHFGQGVGIDGDTIVSGSFQDDDNGNGSGSAYVFVRSGTTWNQQAKLLPGDGVAEDEFGLNVAIDGDFVVAGAHGHHIGGIRRGAAYVFERTGSTWTEVLELSASDGAENDAFGYPVAIGDCVTLVGAGGDDDGGFANVGAVYLYEALPILRFSGPSELAGTELSQETGTFYCTLEPACDSLGVEAWSYGFTVSSPTGTPQISNFSLAGTDAANVIDLANNFQSFEILSGGDSATSAVVLSTMSLTTLPDGVVSSVAKFDVTATMPDPPVHIETVALTFEYVAGLVGPGQPVPLEIIRDGSVVTPRTEIFETTLRATGFIRGDLNEDDDVTLSDAIALFRYLFLGFTDVVDCHDAHDFNDDGLEDVSDGVAILGYLFTGSFVPPFSVGACVFDLTADSLLCAEFDNCLP